MDGIAAMLIDHTVRLFACTAGALLGYSCVQVTRLVRAHARRD